MPIPLTVAGTTILYPVTGEVSWGDQATLWAQLVTNAIGSGGNPVYNSIVVLTSSDFQGPVDFGDDVTFTGTSPTLYGDMSSSPVGTNRFKMQSSVPNGNTVPFLVPNGTATLSGWGASNGSDPDNSATMALYIDPTGMYISSDKLGLASSYVPMVFHTSNAERMRINVDGRVGIGTTSPGRKLAVEDISNGYNGINVSNTDPGAAARTAIVLSNGPAYTAIGINGTGFAGSPLNSFIEAKGPFTTNVDGIERMRIDNAGDVILSGASRKIKAEFSSAPFATGFQTSATNNITVVTAQPSGTGNAAYYRLHNSSDPNNTSLLQISSTSTIAGINSDKIGTGTYLPLSFGVGGAERMAINVAGDTVFREDVSIVKNTTAAVNLTLQNNNSTPGAGTSLYMNQNGGPQFRILSSSYGLSNLGNLSYFPMSFLTNNFERMTITRDGGFIVGAALVSDANGYFQLNTNALGNSASFALRNTVNGLTANFWTLGPNANHAFVVLNAAATGVYMNYGDQSWSATSDITVKTDLVDISGQNLWDWFKTVRTMTGRFKTDSEDKKRPFLIAQDWEDKPGVTNTFDEKLGMTHTDTLPYAYAVIKELMKKVEALEEIIRNK